MKVGYARISTSDKGQNTTNQESRLREDGCQVIFTDEGQSGAKASRPGWDAALAFLQPGDVLVSVRLDRFGRSVQHLLKLSDDMQARGIGIRCLDQPVDTSTPMGKMVFTILAAVAEFERALLIERTNDGLATARAEGKQIGAPKSLSDEQEKIVVQLHAGGMKAADIAVMTGSSRRTVYRTLERAQAAAVA